MAQGSIISIDDPKNGLIKNGYTWAIETAKEINSKQLGWWFVLEYPLVAADKRIQVRNIKFLAPLQEVNDYKQAMEIGDQFPPVIVTRDGWLVDGHTRTEAARKLGWDTFPAFVLNVSYGDLDPKSPMRKTLLKLGAAQNNKHGRRMTAMDIAGLIEQVAEGDTPKQIQREMHVGYSTANTVWNASRTKRNAEKLGVPYRGELTNSHLKLFGGKIEKYTDPVWGKLFKLTQDAHLGVTEITSLMSRVEALRSEEERLNFLDSETEHHRPAITSNTHVSPSQARRVKQGLGYMMKDENAPEDLTEKDPAKGPEYLRFLMDSRMKLDKIIFRQEEIESARVAN